MSTRAIIHIYDELDGFNIYVQRDGFPQKVKALVEEAKAFAWSLPRFEAWDFATALIKVLKQEPWNIYLINTTESLGTVDYYYQLTSKAWNLYLEISNMRSKNHQNK